MPDDSNQAANSHPLSTYQVADALGCDKATVLNLVEQGRLGYKPVLIKGQIRKRFALEAVNAVKEELVRLRTLEKEGFLDLPDGKIYYIRKAAELMKLPYYLLRAAIGLEIERKEAELEAIPNDDASRTDEEWIAAKQELKLLAVLKKRDRSRRLDKAGLPRLPFRLLPALRGAKPKIVIAESDLLGFADAVRRLLRRGRVLDRNRWKTSKEIAVQHRGHAMEVVECLKCWVKARLLLVETALTQKSLKAPHRNVTGIFRSVPKILNLTLYDSDRFDCLWRDLSPEKGADRARGFFASGAPAKPLSDFKAYMYKLGFAGPRYHAARRLAGVVREKKAFGAGFTCRLTGNPQPLWKRTTLQEAKTRLERKLRNGPVEVSKGKSWARRVGLTPFALKRARMALRVKNRFHRMGGPVYWCLPNQKAPGSEANNGATADPAERLTSVPESGQGEETPTGEAKAWKKKRRRRSQDNQYPLTERQTEAMLLYRDKGNYAAGARTMGIKRAPFRKLCQKAMKKLGQSATKRFLRTQSLPTDRRGQAIVPAPMPEDRD
jgi:DNA-binding CsgD family transcriptional regulator